jgi:hypothetical protein
VTGPHGCQCPDCADRRAVRRARRAVRQAVVELAGTPTAEVVSITPYPNTRGLRVRCPTCGREHLHGLPWGDDEPRQHRVAHCHRGGDYWIDVPAWAAELVRPGRAGHGDVR